MRTLLLTLLAGAIAFVLDLVICFMAPRFTGAPQDFPPFTALPILARKQNHPMSARVRQD